MMSRPSYLPTLRQMLNCCLLAWLAAILIATCPATAAERTLDVVLDLDWTTFYEVPCNGPYATIGILASTDGGRTKCHRPSDWAVPLVQMLRDVKIRPSFYSGGNKERNLTLLQSVTLPSPDRRSLWDLAYKVLNFDPKTGGDLVDQFPDGNAPAGCKFWQRYKKDLRKVTAPRNPKDAILVDDIEHFVVAGQDVNAFWLGETYNYYATWEEAQLARKKAEKEGRQDDLIYIPSTEAKWWLERNKLAWVAQVIHQARQLALDPDDPIPFSQAIKRVKEEYSSTEAGRKALTLQGINLLRTYGRP